MVPELSGGCPTGMDGVRWGEQVESTCLEMLVEGGRNGGGEGRGVGGEEDPGVQGEGGGMAQHPRARPKPPDIRARVEPKPHTVMLNCRKFAVLQGVSEASPHHESGRENTSCRGGGAGGPDGGSSFPRSFAAVVKSAKFVEQEAERSEEVERQKQERVAKKVQEDRRKEDEKAEREAAKEAEEARRNVEAAEKRSTLLAKLAENSKKAKEHKEKVKSLADQTKEDLKQAKDYERELDDIYQGEGSRKRSAPPSSPSLLLQQPKKPSPNTEDGRL